MPLFEAFTSIHSTAMLIALLVFPAAVILIYRILTKPQPAWRRLNELKQGSSKTAPPSGKTLWLDGEWEVRSRRGPWHSVKLPCDLATLPGFAELRRIYFRRTIAPGEIPGKGRLFIGTHGAGGFVTIRINGKTILNKCAGLLPVESEIPENAIESGKEIKIEFKVERDPGSDFIRHMRLGPQFACGLFRDIYLQSRPEVFARNIRIEKPPLENPEIIVEINGQSSEPVALTLVIEGTDGKKLLSFERILSGVSGVAETGFKLPSNIINEWNTAAPNIYKAKVSIAAGDISGKMEKTFGIRQPEIFLNEKMPSIVGAFRAENFPPYGSALPAWAAKRDIDLAAETGINLLWASPFPFNPSFLDLCDARGILAVQELPLSDMLSGGGEDAAKRIDEAVRESMSHPSLLFWALSSPSAARRAARDSEVYTTLQKHINAGNIVMTSGVETALGLKNKNILVLRDFLEMGGVPDPEDILGAAAANIDTIEIAAIDLYDGTFGKEGSAAVESRRAAADDRALRSAAVRKTPAIVIGQMFSWGFRTGIISASRKKKMSGDIIKNFVISGRSAAPENALIKKSNFTKVTAIFSALAMVACISSFGSDAALFAISTSSAAALVSAPLLAAIRLLAIAATAFSLADSFENRPEITLSAAHLLRFPEFSKFASSAVYKIAACSAYSIWATGAAFATLNAFSKPDMRLSLEALSIGALAETLVLAAPAAGANPAIALCCAFFLEGAIFAQFYSPAAAFTAAAIMAAPAIIAAAAMAKKEPET